ncbi:rhodanese-like domain-containing protein [Sediminibacterium sp.]|jgi:rhodanese-related sulfurtransferase|uniref:rhodanese-like domain-containing protein n=1 Tax=Sediminibacterium sp. TaxID=1917865 RepID=UPI0025F05C80|nr:rhodanese-like domain-containing protein [Sediminibacterium sp.]MBW0177080.1 rhodanese-like domain-containing protein [Sediminibacterium sp.]
MSNLIGLLSRLMLFSITTMLILSCTFSPENEVAEKPVFKCLPCGLDCDMVLYEKEGICKHCEMELVPASTITFKTIEPSAICEYISQHPEVVLLDVRTKEEFEGNTEPDFGTLKNAINLPIQELEANMTSLEQYKNKDIIVFCSHSHRSPRASYMLTQNGFKRVTNMAGGMSVLADSSCKK